VTGDPLHYVTLYATANVPRLFAGCVLLTEYSRVKGLQKVAAVDRNKRLKMFWLKIYKPNAFG
jgi:hypothetical protein